MAGVDVATILGAVMAMIIGGVMAAFVLAYYFTTRSRGGKIALCILALWLAAAAIWNA